MFGWLIAGAQKSRVLMCTKELKWDLESADDMRRSMILLLGQHFRLMTVKNGIENDAFDKPENYTKDEMLQFYTAMEGLRNNATLERERLRKLARLGGVFPQYAEDHSKNCNRGIEIWMCTVGTVFAQSAKKDVTAIWKMFLQQPATIRRAFDHLKDIAQRTHKDTGAGGDMLADVTMDDWLAAANFVPTAYRPK
jgi:hypothetical protein